MSEFIHDGKELELQPYGVEYSNDMMNGVLLDGDETYAFASIHTEDGRRLIDDIDEDYEGYDMSEQDIDWDKAPHSWIRKSVEKLIVASAEGLLCQD